MKLHKTNADVLLFLSKCLASLDGKEQLVKVDCKLLTSLKGIKEKSSEIILSLGDSNSCNNFGIKYNLGNFHLFHRENFGLGARHFCNSISTHQIFRNITLLIRLSARLPRHLKSFRTKPNYMPLFTVAVDKYPV